MKNLIFESWNSWKVCFLAGCSKFLWGLWRIITCIILGIVSVLVFVGKQIEKFCRRETVASFIIAFVFLGLSFGWISTYMDSRMKIKNAECQRDSASVRLSRYLQAYDTSSIIIIDKDTIQ